MDGIRDDFFAGAAFPDNQDRRIGGSHQFDLLQDFTHFFVLAENPFETETPFQFFAERSILILQFQQLHQTLHDQQQLIHGKGLRNIVVRTHFHRFDGSLHRSVSGDDNDAGARRHFFASLQHLQAIQTRKAKIGDDDVELLLLNAVHAF